MLGFSRWILEGQKHWGHSSSSSVSLMSLSRFPLEIHLPLAHRVMFPATQIWPCDSVPKTLSRLLPSYKMKFWLASPCWVRAQTFQWRGQCEGRCLIVRVDISSIWVAWKCSSEILWKSSSKSTWRINFRFLSSASTQKPKDPILPYLWLFVSDMT